MTACKYIEHLYSNDLEGYVQVIKLNNGQALEIINTNIKGVVDVVERQQGEQDTYITPNSFYIPQRNNENIRHFRALYIDLDIKGYGKEETIYMAHIKAQNGEIPKPSMIIDSGRGVHLYWRIEHAPKGASYTWQELEDYLYKQLKDLGADIQATDCARVMRLPDTINSKNLKQCQVIEKNDIRYSMYALREQYLGYKPMAKQENSPSKATNGQVKRLFNSYTLHLARAEDIETLASLRGYDIRGHRNAFTHLYSYWKGIYIRERAELQHTVSNFNKSFLEPLRESEVKAIVKSTEKAIEKFIDYEQGIRSGDKKRISKAMRERGGYWYTNDRLIELLEITDHEQSKLKTIISAQEKNRRKTKARYNSRRNADGLTLRQQQKQDNIDRVQELAKQGLKQVDIAKQLKLGKSTVSMIINDVY